MSHTEQELFFYNGDGVTTENLALYTTGGFHPVILGDVLPRDGTCTDDVAKRPRYRVSQKLGHGAFSTVWLVRDLEKKRYASLKVCQGTKQPTQSNESKVLKHLSHTGQGKTGYEHTVELYDVFTIRGPNGFHECVVTEVVLPLDTMFLRQKLQPRRAIKQLLRGFAFLHSEGIFHGDPNYGNFGIAIPQLQELEESTIADHFANPEVVPVVPRDPSFPRDSVPSYLTETASLGSLILDSDLLPPAEEVCLKILDFGRSSWIMDPPLDLPGAAPPTVRPPEVHMHELSGGKVESIWTQEADVWGVGCIAYQIFVGGDLFSVQGNSQYQLYQNLRLGGPPPEHWSKYWDLKTFSEDTKTWRHPCPPVLDHEAAWESHRPEKIPDSDVFLDFIRKMIVTEPAQRSQLSQLMDHPFLANGSP